MWCLKCFCEEERESRKTEDQVSGKKDGKFFFSKKNEIKKNHPRVERQEVQVHFTCQTPHPPGMGIGRRVLGKGEAVRFLTIGIWKGQLKDTGSEGQRGRGLLGGRVGGSRRAGWKVFLLFLLSRYGRERSRRKLFIFLFLLFVLYFLLLLPLPNKRAMTTVFPFKKGIK